MDEAGSRVKLKQYRLPALARILDYQLRELRKTKQAAVRAQEFELAGRLRCSELLLLTQIETIISSQSQTSNQPNGQS